jgi:hypothetical protein
MKSYEPRIKDTCLTKKVTFWQHTMLAFQTTNMRVYIAADLCRDSSPAIRGLCSSISGVSLGRRDLKQQEHERMRLFPSRFETEDGCFMISLSTVFLPPFAQLWLVRRAPAESVSFSYPCSFLFYLYYLSVACKMVVDGYVYVCVVPRDTRRRAHLQTRQHCCNTHTMQRLPRRARPSVD